MENIMNVLEEKLIPVANKVSTNKYLSAISNGFSLIMPILIIGAILSLIVGLPFPPYQAFLTNAGLLKVLMLIPMLTTDLLSIYVVFSIAYAYTVQIGRRNDAYIAGLLALLSFLIITPIEVGEELRYISFDWLGSTGLFMAIIVGLLVSFLYNKIVDRDWTLKLPEGVPPTISKSFSALIPGFIIVAVFAVITFIFGLTTAGNPHAWLYGIIEAPLSTLSGSIWTYLFLGLMSSVLWFFGLHGGMIVMPFLYMLFTTAGVENQAAYLAGQPLPHILTVTFLNLLMLGGVGATLSLNILMLFVGKSTRYKTLAKLSIAPSLCGINEPIMFGFPMMLNPIMALPFVLVPTVNTVITYFVMKIGLVSAPRLASAAFGTPVFLDAFLLVGFMGILLQVVLIILDMAIYYPFFKIQDNLAYEEETVAVE